MCVRFYRARVSLIYAHLWHFICLMTNQTIRHAAHIAVSMSKKNRNYIHLRYYKKQTQNTHTHTHTMICLPSLLYTRQQVSQMHILYRMKKKEVTTLKLPLMTG